MLPDTAGLSLHRFLDRRHSLCSAVESTAGMLRKTVTIFNSNTTVSNNVSYNMH